MSEKLDAYLSDSYRHDVMGESVQVRTPADPQLIAEIEAAIARIDGLRLGAHLANRDVVSYHNRKALVRLLAILKAQGAQNAADREGPEDHGPHEAGVRSR